VIAYHASWPVLMVMTSCNEWQRRIAGWKAEVETLKKDPGQMPLTKRSTRTDHDLAEACRKSPNKIPSRLPASHPTELTVRTA